MNSLKWLSVSCGDLLKFYQGKSLRHDKATFARWGNGYRFRPPIEFKSDLAGFVRVLTCPGVRHIVQPFETLTRDLP